MRWLLVAVMVVGTLSSACSLTSESGSSQASPGGEASTLEPAEAGRAFRTDLAVRIQARAQGGWRTVRRFRLVCDGASGEQRKLCRAIGAAGEWPGGGGVICDCVFSDQRLTVHGTRAGRPFRKLISNCTICGASKGVYAPLARLLAEARA
jgi:hypothetical protein